MLLSTAVVTTDASARYGKQLLAHLGHKVTMEPLPDQPAPAGRLLFAYGVGTVLPMPGQLILQASAADLESLAHVQDVLQRHLEKFGARRELVDLGPGGNRARWYRRVRVVAGQRLRARRRHRGLIRQSTLPAAC